MPLAVTLPASMNAGTNSTASGSAPAVCRLTHESAATSASTCPRNVESLRLTSSTRAPSRPAVSTRQRAALSVSSAAVCSPTLRELVSKKQVPASPPSAAAHASSSGAVTTCTPCTACDPVGSSSMTPTSTSPAARIPRIDSRSAPASRRAGGRLANSAEAAGRLWRTEDWLTNGDDVEEQRDALPRPLGIRVGELEQAFDDESGLREGLGVGLERPVLAVEG